MAVDLHIVRAQFGPQAQAGIAGAQVIEGDGEAHGAVVVQRRVEQGEILDGRLLGQLDHHVAGRDAEGLQQLQRAAGLVGRFQQRLRRDVEEQLARQLQVAETRAGLASAKQLQLAQATAAAGDAEQCQRRVQRAVGRAACKGFVAHQASFGQRQDGLEQAVQVAVSEDLVQRAQLLGDGHDGSRWLEKQRAGFPALCISRQCHDCLMSPDQCLATWESRFR